MNIYKVTIIQSSYAHEQIAAEVAKFEEIFNFLWPIALIGIGIILFNCFIKPAYFDDYPTFKADARPKYETMAEPTTNIETSKTIKEPVAKSVTVQGITPQSAVILQCPNCGGKLIGSDKACRYCDSPITWL